MIKSALAIFTSLLFIHAGLAPAAAQTVNNAAKKAPAKKVVAKRPAQAVSKTVAKGSLNNREKLVRKVSVVKGKRHISYQRVSAAPSIPVVPPV